MALLDPVTDAARLRDHGFHQIRVSRVVPETAEASSFVLDVPTELRSDFSYKSGQFCTFRIWVDGQPYIRCYSMSSAPAVDAELRVTVKRTPHGVVSNWMNDHVAAGDLIEVARPAGFFQLRGDGDVVAFSAGSGITPVLSLIKSATVITTRPVRLLYANRDHDAIIFRGEIEALRQQHGERLAVAHHLDADSGFVTAEEIRSFAGSSPTAQYYICGPGPFMDVVEETLLAGGVDPLRIHIERFTPVDLLAEPEPDGGVDEAATATRVTITLHGRTESTDHHAGTTILQTARQMGMAPPFSCESGSCATCMAMVREGTVTMHVNNALTEDEIAEGWVLTCQSVPTSPTIDVVYE
jgi:3-ketosteroid 9alpha-monooxygenase subunit B